MKTLYLDALFLLNILTDYLLCLTVARLCGFRLRRRRYLLSALFGATYALISVFPGCRLFTAPLWKLCAGLGMGAIAFGCEARPLRGILALFFVSAAFGGALYALTLMGGGPAMDLRLLLAAFFLFYTLLRLLTRFRSRLDGQRKAQIRLCLAQRESHFPALIDSGNSLTDPGTGEEVLVVSPAALEPILQSYTSLVEELSPVDLIELSAQIPPLAGRMRLLPYRTLSGGGLLPAFRPDGIWVDGAEVPGLLVAISRQARGDGFDAIL